MFSDPDFGQASNTEILQCGLYVLIIFDYSVRKRRRPRPRPGTWRFAHVYIYYWKYYNNIHSGPRAIIKPFVDGRIILLLYFIFKASLVLIEFLNVLSTTPHQSHAVPANVTRLPRKFSVFPSCPRSRVRFVRCRTDRISRDVFLPGRSIENLFRDTGKYFVRYTGVSIWVFTALTRHCAALPLGFFRSGLFLIRFTCVSSVTPTVPFPPLLVLVRPVLYNHRLCALLTIRDTTQCFCFFHRGIPHAFRFDIDNVDRILRNPQRRQLWLVLGICSVSIIFLSTSAHRLSKTQSGPYTTDFKHKNVCGVFFMIYTNRCNIDTKVSVC